jgi:hypothetical protein
MTKKWELKEISDAKNFKGKRVPGSGNHWGKPGDVKTDKFLIEVKQTDKKSYSLSVDKLNKIYEEALFSYRIPLFSIKIQETEVVLLFKEDFEKLIQVQ